MTLLGERRALTIGLVLAITMVAFEALAAATAFPKVLDDLGGVSLYGWAFSGFMLASLVGIVVAGQQCDTHGPAAPMAWGLLVFGAGLAIVGAANSMTVVVVGRLVQGFGAGATPAVAYVAIGRGYPEALRPRMFAVLSTAWVVPGLIGPGISGAVAEHLTWRLVFFGLLPLLPFCAALLFAALRELGPSGEPARAPVARAIVLAIAAGCVVGGLGADSLIGIPFIVVGVLVGVRVVHELLPEGSLVAAPGVPAAMGARALLTFSFFGADVYVTLMLTTVRHQSATVAGLALTAATLTWTAGSWVQARLAGRRSFRTLARAGIAFVLVGIGGLAAVTSSAVPVFVAALAWAVAGLGMGLAYSMPSLVVLAEASEAEVGATSAALSLSEVLGTALGTGLGGAIVAAGASAGWAAATPFLLIDALVISVGFIGIIPASRLPNRFAA